MNESIQARCLELRRAYEEGLLGNQSMPEDFHPTFSNIEERLSFFTLPMALNYQRNSYTLWEAATKAFEDPAVRPVFTVRDACALSEDDLRPLLVKHRVALQPNKHTRTWHIIATTIESQWGSIEGLLHATDFDFLRLQHQIQTLHKKGFPYLSGPKIFHYWSYILGEYCEIRLKNREYIQIAPDTHVLKCSVRLGILTEQEAQKLSREKVSERWREMLDGTGLSPMDMHTPLWFWSRNKFSYELES